MPTAHRMDIGKPPTGPFASTGPTASTASTASTDGARLFPGFEVTSAVRIDSAPAAAGATFIGSAFPRDGRSSLSFYGFNAEGTLWRVDTNPSCVGTVLTSVGGQPAVVILDSDARQDGQGPVSFTTATAFSAGSGDVLWGPTEVPGPSAGNGLIFANTPKALTAGTTPGTLLDAGTGSVVETPAGETALYEHHGAALIGTESKFLAVDTGSRGTLWSADELRRPNGTTAGAKVRFTGSYGPATGGVVVLRWEEQGMKPQDVVYDLRTGEPLGQLAGSPAGMAVTDGSSGTVLLASELTDGSQLITAVRPGAGTLWTKSFARSARITAAGPGGAYAELDGVAAKIDIDSGAILDTGDYVLPVSLLPDGTALFPTKERTVYALAVPEKQGAPG
ncbi:hypothetical protein SAMN04489742_1121 [Arthrobacter crystallopoietes]|uniref:PQQ-like domain-containing protein n=1 Tax=Crystallibacter crystallopoietes TaxID=37928 RepID=A0A1H1AWJ3_9MICC|nr:hypothetical protein SAMN04489742_1121 [Arthrobacter crystallopoietes]